MKSNDLQLTRYLPWAGLCALLAITWLAYQPGLSGGFLFDDFANLTSLGNSGPVQDWPGFWRYITSGTADPSGRPLALLSFWLNANDWPAAPLPFLRSNVLLHLLNGALLFALLRRLDRVLDCTDSPRYATALFAAALWMLHPLLVSTTLYVVQREAMLPTTFVIMGLLAFSIGRERFARTDGREGSAWMAVGIGLGTALSLLCKGNGMLLPLLAWVLESTVFRSSSLEALGANAKTRLGRVKATLLVVPTVLVFAYLCSFLPLWNADLPNRPWTIGQRMLTEPRILIDYLRLLIVPRSISAGLYNDSFPASLSLWRPASTLPALLLLAGLVLAGFRFRRTAPRLAAALLFFLTGHLLESTVVPLELYFEHRNYLPALLLFWPLAHAIRAWNARWQLRLGVATALIGLLAITTHQRAELWAQAPSPTGPWMSQNSDSSRALATLAIELISSGHQVDAMLLLGPRWQRKPEDGQLGVNYIDAACTSRGVTHREKQAMAKTMQTARDGQELIYGWLADSIRTADSGRCPGLQVVDVEAWIAQAEKNPALAQGRYGRHHIEQLKAELAMSRRHPAEALQHFDRALLAKIAPEVALRQAAKLASQGYYSEGLAHLDFYERVKIHAVPPGIGMPWLHAKVLTWQDYWPHEMAWMRSELRARINAQVLHN